ncbi:MAG: hypothetical protein OSB41_04470 [Kiritimatiellae bacterium]|jgi:urease accessory protein|nr:hypothetical protein [Kiritimatiellia bacterium]
MNPKSNATALTEFDVLHIADSALPVGGFAFSNGLESAFKLGMIRNRPEFDAYVQNLIDQLLGMDLPFLRSMHAGAEQPDQVLAEILEDWAASLASAPAQRCSLRQGKGMLRWLQTVHPSCDMMSFSTWLQNETLNPHYLPVFAIGLARCGLSLERVEHLYLFIAIRDQMSAAVRLGMLGPMDAQCLQHTLQAYAFDAYRTSPIRNHADAARSCPLVELAQAYHDNLYSRLFQN